MKNYKSTYKVLENQIAELSKQNSIIRLNSDFENKEKKKRAAQLLIARKELAFQNKEKQKRASELIIANKELIFQNTEKEKRATELSIADKELAFQNEEKEKRASELEIANKELIFQNEEKEKRAKELIVANKELIELTQLNHDKDSFISILVHDLRSPFSSILGFLNLLSENIYVYNIEQIEEHINTIRYSAQNTYNLLEDLIIWAMSKSGKLPYEPEDLNFKELCQQEIELFKLSATAKNIAINCFVSDEITLCYDKNMLRTILRNLISNAIKFTNKGGHIDINTEKTTENITISITDNGIGIESDILINLFDASLLHTTPGTKNESGSGLGLMLCKIFSEKNGGTILVNSEVGIGSTFTITIPIPKNKTKFDCAVSKN